MTPRDRDGRATRRSYVVDDNLARSVVLGPTDGDDWTLSLNARPDTPDPHDRELVDVRLSPRALHELYVEARDLSPDARQAGHTAECALCGESVPFDRAVPSARDEPVHRRCYVDAYGGPDTVVRKFLP